MGLIMFCHRHCSHCYHVDNGPIWMHVPHGHVQLRCCKCGATKLEHREHVTQYVPYVWPTTIYQPSYWEVCRPGCGSVTGWSFSRDAVRPGRWT